MYKMYNREGKNGIYVYEHPASRYLVDDLIDPLDPLVTRYVPIHPHRRLKH